MKKIAMAAMGALMAAGVTAATTAPAEARVTIGIGIGGPGYGYGGGYYPPSFCDPYSYNYNPYRCDRWRYGRDYYYDPIYFGGVWYRGPFRYRDYGGRREFFVRGGWHRNEWSGPRPSHYGFHDGWRGDHHRHH
jgi:hypothetical protein